MSLKIGYDLFKGASQQSGPDGTVSTVGVVQVETAKGLPYYIRIQRLSDSEYWNDTTKAFQAGIPAQADELLIPGSTASQAGVPTMRRLAANLPSEAVTGIDADGCLITAYALGDAVGAGVAMTLAFQLKQ